MTYSLADIQEETITSTQKQMPLEVSKKDISQKIIQAQETARAYMAECGITYEDAFEEQKLVKFAGRSGERAKTEWLRCSLFERNGIPVFRLVFGSFHNSLIAFQNVTKEFNVLDVKELSEDELKELKKKIDESKKQSDLIKAKERAEENKKADECLDRFYNANRTGSSPYFERKGLKCLGDIRYEEHVFVDTNCVELRETIALVPLRNAKGNIRAIQEIYPTKRPFNGSNKDIRDKNNFGPSGGCFFALGSLEDGRDIYVCEGVATAGSLFESAQVTTVAVISRTNILKVLQEFKKHYPRSEITICGDDDIDTEGNPGRTDAITAALKYKCKVVFPKFPDDKRKDENGKSYTDFNDLMLVSGKDEVRRQIAENAYVPVSEKALEKKERQREVVKPENISTPILKIFPGKTHEIATESENILLENNVGIFQRYGQLVRIVKAISNPKKTKLLDREGKEIFKRSPDALIISEIDPIYLCELLDKHAVWIRFDARIGEWVRKDCPGKVAATLIARREWNFPVLTGIIQAPTLRPDGSILDAPGYDEITGLFFNAGDCRFLTIPAHPSKDDAKKALEILLYVLKDFPFVNDESKSVAVSAILTSVVRKSIRTAPLHAVDAPKMASGKSLLTDIVGIISTGKVNTVISYTDDETEERKRILAVLGEGDQIVCYDNIEGDFRSATLCSVLTQTEYKDRILGNSKTLSVPTNATFLANGNNIRFVGDISTRVISCRIDPQCERPEEREFDVDLRKYVPAHRGELVTAALTILRAYHVAGRPKQDIKQFGRFEEWSDLIRSSLVWLGMADPCASRKEIERADPVRVALGSLLEHWFAVFDSVPVKANSVVKKAQEHPELKEALLELATDGKGGINERVLGKKLASFKGRVENGYRLETSGESQHALLWRVKKMN